MQPLLRTARQPRSTCSINSKRDSKERVDTKRERFGAEPAAFATPTHTDPTKSLSSDYVNMQHTPDNLPRSKCWRCDALGTPITSTHLEASRRPDPTAEIVFELCLLPRQHTHTHRFRSNAQQRIRKHATHSPQPIQTQRQAQTSNSRQPAGRQSDCTVHLDGDCVRLTLQVNPNACTQLRNPNACAQMCPIRAHKCAKANACEQIMPTQHLLREKPHSSRSQCQRKKPRPDSF